MHTVNHFPIHSFFFFFHWCYLKSFQPAFGKRDFTEHFQKCVTLSVWRDQLQLTYVKHLGRTSAAELNLMMHQLSHSTVELLNYLEHISLLCLFVWFGFFIPQSRTGSKYKLSKEATAGKFNPVLLGGIRTSPLLCFLPGEICPKSLQLPVHEDGLNCLTGEFQKRTGHE